MPARASSSRGGADHRLQVPEVGRGDGDLGGDDDLILGRHRLGVVALHPPARGLDVARVEIAEVDLARRDRAAAANGLRRTAEAAAVLHPPAARGRPRRRRWRGTRSGALLPGGAWPRGAGRAGRAGSAAPPRRAARRGGAWRRAASRAGPARSPARAAARRRARRRTARPLRHRRRRPRRGSRARSARSRASPAARRWPRTFVPSTAITPTRTSPASAQSASTSPNSSASARS